MGLEKKGNHKPKTKREKNGFYISNPKDIYQIIDILNIDKNASILEPCAGIGHISETLKKIGYKNITTNDLVKRDYKLDYNIDFINCEMPIKKYDYILTNPPFAKAKDIIERSLEYADTIIILAKLDLLESASRKHLNNKYLQHVYVHSVRAKFGLNGDESYFKKSTSMSTAWFIYNKNKVGKTTLEVI